MISVDTNILLRLTVVDDVAQQTLAKAFFAARSADDPAYIGNIVLAEFAWVLTRRYGYSKDQVGDLILTLLQSPDLVVERPGVVEDAVDLSRHPTVSFADALVAGLAAAAGCRKTVTFDKDAAKRIPGMELLA
jgi:predicted nucleic-acid-binding protein